MPEIAGGGRRPMDEADVRAIIDRPGGGRPCRRGERSSTRPSCA